MFTILLHPFIDKICGVLYILRMFKYFCRDFSVLILCIYMCWKPVTLCFCSLLGDLIFMMPHNSDRQILAEKVM